METFSVRDLREHTGALIHGAELGKLSLVTKRGRPVFLAVPFDKALIDTGLSLNMAIRLYQEGAISTGNAAKLSGLPVEAFLKTLGALRISVFPEYTKGELEHELKSFAAPRKHG